MRITIQGNSIDVSDIDGLDSLTWSEETDEQNVLQRRVSGQLTLKGAAYTLIADELINDPAGLTKQLDVILTEDCCNAEIEAVITPDGLQWCESDCQVRVTLTEKADQLTCFKSTWTAHNMPTASFPSGFQNYAHHPKVSYCIELRPNWLQDIVMILGVLINLWLLIQSVIVLIIGTIISIMCGVIKIVNNIIAIVGGDPPPDCPDKLEDGLMDEFRQMRDTFNNLIVGCGRKHPSPLVRDYIKNGCEKCGLSFESTILNNPTSPYHNLLYLYAPAKKGYMAVTEYRNYIPDNAPYQTLDMFMNDLCNVFNAKYVIKNNTLKFERKDILAGGIVYDFANNDKGRIYGQLCYKWNGNKRPAYTTMEYEKDAIDYVGNEARDRGNDVIDFNNPVKPYLQGERKVTLPFGLSRYRDDGIERDVLSAYKNVVFLSNTIAAHSNELIMAQSTTYLPKLLIWDGVDLDNAKIKISPTPTGYEVRHPDEDAPPPLLYNYQMWFDRDSDVLQPNLWSFHKIDDPNISSVRNFSFTVSMYYNCNDLAMLNDLIGSMVSTPRGTGIIEGWTLRFKDGIIDLKGTI